MLQDRCESLIQVEYLAGCRGLCWPLEMQAVSRLCTGALSLLPSSLSSLFQLLEQKDCRLSGLNSSSFSTVLEAGSPGSECQRCGFGRTLGGLHTAAFLPPFHPLVSEVPCFTVGPTLMARLSSGTFQRPSLLMDESGATQTCSPRYRSGRTSWHCPSGLSFLPSAFSPCFLDPVLSFQTCSGWAHPLTVSGERMDAR